MPDKFAWAQQFVAKWEGGYTDHPADRGGPTAYGVSTRFIENIAQKARGRELLARLGIPAKPGRADMKKVTPACAAALFRCEFWDPARLDELPARTALVIYDAAVNSGLSRGVRFMQQAARNCGANIAADGIVGPLTIRALARDEDAHINEALRLRQAFYNSICANDKSQICFLKGWSNRLNDLRQYLKTV